MHANYFPLIEALLFGSILRESDIIKNFYVNLQKSLNAGGKVNPIIGSAGLSAFPIPAWGAHIYGQENSSSNCLLLHAMAVNISGIISGAVVVGILLAFFH